MHCGIEIDPDETNAYLTRRDVGVFVWSNRTVTKLEDLKVNGTIQFKQLKLVCGALELMYSLMMANADVIRDGVPLQLFLDQLN